MRVENRKKVKKEWQKLKLRERRKKKRVDWPFRSSDPKSLYELPLVRSSNERLIKEKLTKDQRRIDCRHKIDGEKKTETVVEKLSSQECMFLFLWYKSDFFGSRFIFKRPSFCVVSQSTEGQYWKKSQNNKNEGTRETAIKIGGTKFVLICWIEIPENCLNKNFQSLYLHLDRECWTPKVCPIWVEIWIEGGKTEKSFNLMNN
jgi:hypothetical protein